MSKKLLIIIISVILGLFLIALVGYYFILAGTGGGGAGGKTSVFNNFFPFGGNTTTEIPVTEEPATTTPQQQPLSNYTNKLRKISSEPVAGAGVVDIKAGSIVRHIEKATGHIFETELFSPIQIRISNTTVPMVYDAVWNSQNTALLARYLKEDDQTIDTFELIIKDIASSTENPVYAIKLPENISDVSIFGSSIFSLQQTDYSSLGYISNFENTNKTLVWNSTIKELLPQYVNSKTIALTTKPHQDIGGYLYFVDTTNGKTTKIIGNMYGLSTLINGLATQVLALTQGNTLQMFLYNIKNNSSVLLTPTTFPEKCVWGKKNINILYCAVPKDFIDRTSLTSWYLGQISYTDDIWRYDLSNNTSTMVEDLYLDSNEQIDVIKPILSENEQYLIFINKIDNSLWSLDLTK